MAIIGTNISLAKQELAAENLVAIPTETVYGLAANGLNEASILKIYAAKNRPSFNPLILHLANKEAVHTYAASVPETAQLLMDQFWPGPLTVVLPKKDIVPDLLTAGHSTVAMRVPNHPLTLELLASLDFPLAAPSANPSGYISPTKASHVQEQLGDQLAYILNGGACTVGVESTIVKFDGEEVIVLRQGGISIEELESVVGAVTTSTEITEQPEAPGMLSSHYAPRTKIVIGNIEELLTQYDGQKIGILSYQDAYSNYPNRILSPAGSAQEAAHNIYQYLRELDESDIDIILTETVPFEGIGRAVNDRLLRAAAKA